MIADTIEEWDEPLLSQLKDIRLRLQTQPLIGFTLEFHFHEQAKEFFRNETLTKFYEMQIESDDEYLFYEGIAIVRSTGCQIDWTDPKVNVTRSSVTNEEQASFFHFFTTPSITTDDLKLATDFQIGHYIREYLIPKAILIYTGELFDDEDDDIDFSEDESDEQQYAIADETGDGEHL